MGARRRTTTQRSRRCWWGESRTRALNDQAPRVSLTVDAMLSASLVVRTDAASAEAAGDAQLSVAHALLVITGLQRIAGLTRSKADAVSERWTTDGSRTSSRTAMALTRATRNSATCADVFARRSVLSQASATALFTAPPRLVLEGVHRSRETLACVFAVCAVEAILWRLVCIFVRVQDVRPQNDDHL